MAVLKTPTFWQRRGVLGHCLWPLSKCYHLARTIHAGCTPAKAPVPVICVGNLTAGGSGKTPVTYALGKLLQKAEKNFHFLSRGYGGEDPGPLQVKQEYEARIVGDEPLLLAELAPTWISRDRLAGAKMAAQAGAELVVMDDGFQNPKIHKDLALLVVDGTYGFGNGFLLPAGPLREPVASGVARAHGVVLLGEDTCNIKQHLPANLPVLHASIEPGKEFKKLKGRPVIAFAGIARPQKFFKLLEDVGADVVETHTFGDHHQFTTGQIRDLIWRAERHKAEVVTTAKDGVRLWSEARQKIKVLDVTLRWKDEDAVKGFLKQQGIL